MFVLVGISGVWSKSDQVKPGMMAVLASSSSLDVTSRMTLISPMLLSPSHRSKMNLDSAQIVVGIWLFPVPAIWSTSHLTAVKDPSAFSSARHLAG